MITTGMCCEDNLKLFSIAPNDKDEFMGDVLTNRRNKM